MPENEQWWLASIKKNNPTLFAKYPITFWSWYIRTYPQDLERLWMTEIQRQIASVYQRKWAQIGKGGTDTGFVGRGAEIRAWTPPQAAGTEAQPPSTLGGGGSKMISPDVIQTATGFETSDGLPLSTELATKMFNDYWNPKSKTPQIEPTQYRTKTSDELESMEAESLRMRNAQMWEEARAEAAKSVGGGPRDWINAWQMNQMKNPWIPTPKTAGEQMQIAYDKAKASAQKLEPLAKAYKSLLSSSESAEAEPLSLSPDRELEMTNVIQRWDSTKKQATALHDVMLAEFGTQASEPRSWGAGGNMTIGAGDVGGGAPRPTTPPTPSWLKDMYPQLGANITPQQIAPLSGQQWGAMPESQRQGWQGFAEWSGAIPMDLLSSMKMMQPETPAGAGRTSWRPSRQRGSV